MKQRLIKSITIIFSFYLSISVLQSQTLDSNTSSNFIIANLDLGYLSEPNEGFPETNMAKGLTFGFGTYNFNEKRQWAKWLNYPKYGITASVLDYGNSELVGRSYTLTPFLEFDIFKKWSFNSSFGGAYIDTRFNSVTNPNNKAGTTDLYWAFRSFLYYNLKQGKTIDWRIGLGYDHKSNGHTKLPNQGFNTFLISTSALIKQKKNQDIVKPNYEKTPTRSFYFSAILGAGQNVLSRIYNTNKEVYTASFAVGKIINETFKIGVGLDYKYYQHYYDIINSDIELVVNDYPEFKESPFIHASAISLYATSELLMSHIGFEFDLGFNIIKPAYQIDWRLNGYDFINANNELEVKDQDLDWYYELKRTVMARLGIKYYIISNDKSPKHNVFVGAHLNSNLGQADFSQITIGYMYRWKKDK